MIIDYIALPVVKSVAVPLTGVMVEGTTQNVINGVNNVVSSGNNVVRTA